MKLEIPFTGEEQFVSLAVTDDIGYEYDTLSVNDQVESEYGTELVQLVT